MIDRWIDHKTHLHRGGDEEGHEEEDEEDGGHVAFRPRLVRARARVVVVLLMEGCGQGGREMVVLLVIARAYLIPP